MGNLLLPADTSTPADPIGTIHIVDDDELLSGALSSLLRSVGYTVELYGSANSFLIAEMPVGASCLVADVRLPGISGLELQDTLRRTGRAMPMILMTGFGDVRMSVQAMKAGAIDFLEKPFRDQDLLDAVSVALSVARTKRVGDNDLPEIRARAVSLSPRERDVFDLVVEGDLNKQIAAKLGIQEVTVKVHRGSVMRKMGAHSIAELTRMATLLEQTKRD
jgi:FixJ family two-component response regulator